MGSVTDLTISGGKLWEAGIRHAFADNAGWGVYIPLVSKAVLDSLTPAQRQAIDAAWTEVVGWAREHAAQQLAQARAVNGSHGITYADPDPAEVAAMRARMIDLQGEIVASSGMNPDVVARVAAALAGL